MNTLEERSQVSDYQRGDELAELKPPDLRAFNPPINPSRSKPTILPRGFVRPGGRAMAIGAAGAVSVGPAPKRNNTARCIRAAKRV